MNNIQKILELYCGDNPLRKNLHQPFQQGDHVFASDGHTLIRVPASRVPVQYAIQDKPSNIAANHFRPADIATPVTLKELTERIDEVPKIPEMEDIGECLPCSECDGDGQVVWEYRHWEKEFDCPECDGTGYSDEATFKETGKTVPDMNHTITLHGFKFKAEYIIRLSLTMLLLKTDAATMKSHSVHTFKDGVCFSLTEYVDVLIKPLLTSENVINN